MNQSEQPWLVAVSAGRWQKKGIQAAIDAGIRVFALDGDDLAEGFELATKYAVVDICDPQAVLEAVKASDVQPDGVISFSSEVGMPAAALLREHYGLAGPNIEVTNALLNKTKQREKWQKTDVPGPHWRAFTSFEDALVHVAEIGYPCVVKPSDSGGSRGVSKLDSQEDLAAAVQDALEASRSNQGIIESFMNGIEYTVETFGDGLTVHVLAVTEKGKVPGKEMVAQQLATPEEEKKADIVAAVAVDSLCALDYMSGPGHTEIILDDDGIARLVEAAGRGGGFMVFDQLVEKASGYDIVTATAVQAVGQVPAMIQIQKTAVTLRFFPSKEGVVTKIEGFSEANLIPGVDAGAFVKLGEQVGVVRGDGDRLGYILSTGSTPAEARTKAAQAESLIQIDVAV